MQYADRKYLSLNTTTTRLPMPMASMNALIQSPCRITSLSRKTS